MWDFDRVRYLHHGWGRVTEVIEDEASRWLPAPLVMAGVHEAVGDLRVWGMWLRVDYTVADPWREGREVSRRVHVSPRGEVFAGVEGSLVVRPQGPDLTWVRFAGRRSSGASGWGRVVGPLTARSVVTRFLDEALKRLDEAASQLSDAEPTGDTDDRPDG